MITIQNSAPQWRNAPVGLTPEEFENPYDVLVHFFYPSNYLCRYRKWLERWLIAAIEDNNKWKRDKLIRCIYTFQRMGQMLDALWIIYQRGDRLTKEETSIRGGIDTPYYEWSNYILDAMKWFNYKDDDFELQELTTGEEQEPFLVVDEFFASRDVFDAKQTLDFWCHSAIVNSWEYSTMDVKELYDFYKEMIRLIEAVFVIVEVRALRDIKKT
ncbi:hypothetical protein [Mucilaginibacter sp.]|uniref:hypothetical protein n=1 Tax=Mucilaginibacter sp. TaxID=1882438 RepID=UPI002623DDA0|nr:hypothetical protein [Mucilaginibacter sp.]